MMRTVSQLEVVTGTPRRGTTMMNALRVSCVLVLLSVWISSAEDTDDDNKFETKYGRHNITMGYRRPTDVLLFHDNFKVDRKWFPYPKVQSKDVCYPPKSSKNYPKFSINAFNVTDLVPKGDGGYAFVTEGGVATGKLCLHLKTQRGKGFNFIVDVWGYYL